MAKPPKRKKINLDYECDAFGCRPRTTPKGSGGKPLLMKPTRRPPEPGPRYDWEVEKIPVAKSFDQPQTDVQLDIEEITAGPGGQTNKQLFKGSYQDAQKEGALSAAAKASNTFNQTNLPKFTETSRQSLVKGGADPRTISPTSKPGEDITIKKIPITKVKEQALRQQLGADYDIAKDQKLMSRTRYKTDPKTGEREAVRKLMYDDGTITDINLSTGRAKITDLTTGKVKYSKSPEIEVEKKGSKRIPSMESIIETPEADVPQEVIEKAQVTIPKKPGYFSKEEREKRQRTRRRKRYAQGSR